jgi:hypothetical protein
MRAAQMAKTQRLNGPEFVIALVSGRNVIHVDLVSLSPAPRPCNTSRWYTIPEAPFVYVAIVLLCAIDQSGKRRRCFFNDQRSNTQKSVTCEDQVRES